MVAEAREFAVGCRYQPGGVSRLLNRAAHTRSDTRVVRIRDAGTRIFPSTTDHQCCSPMGRHRTQCGPGTAAEGMTRHVDDLDINQLGGPLTIGLLILFFGGTLVMSVAISRKKEN